MTSTSILDNRFSRDLKALRLHSSYGKQTARRLLFPSSWEPELASYVGPMNQAVTQWFIERGFIDDPSSLSIIEQERNDLYSGYPFSWASFDRCALITKVNAMWLLFNDVASEHNTDYWAATQLSFDDYERALCSDALSLRAVPFLRAWHELFESMATSMSHGWRKRFVDHYLKWLSYKSIEREAYAPFVTKDSQPDLDAYIDIRTVTIGMQPVYLFIEFAQGFEVPQEALLCNEMRDLHEIGTRLVLFANDLACLEKDMDIGWPNAVTVIRSQYGLSLQEAIEFLIRLHNDYISKFVDIEHSLPSFNEHTDTLVKHYLSRVHYVIRGFSEWALRAERYRWKHSLINERPIVIASFTDTYDP